MKGKRYKIWISKGCLKKYFSYGNWVSNDFKPWIGFQNEKVSNFLKLPDSILCEYD